MRQAILLGTLAGTDILISFVTQWFLFVKFGAGVEMNALYASLILPSLVLSVIGSSLTYSLVPLLTSESPDRFRQNAWTVFLLVGAGFAAFAVLAGILASVWAPLLVPGLSSEGKVLAIQMTRIQMIGVVFTALVGVLVAAYHAQRCFIRAGVAPVIGDSLQLILLVRLLPRYGIVAQAWLTVLSVVVQLILLLPVLGRFHRPDLRSSILSELWRRMRPLLVGGAYYRTDPMVDRYLSSMTHGGGLSLLALAQKLFDSGNQILNKAIAAPLVPTLAALAKRGEWRSYRRSYRKRLLLMSGLVGGIYLVVAIAGQLLLRILIGHGKFTAGNVHTLWFLMLCLGGVLVGGAVGQITTVSFYAFKNTHTPARLGIWSYTFYIPLKVLAFQRFQLAGLATATSLFTLFNSGMQLLLLERVYLPGLEARGESIDGEIIYEQ